MAVRNIVKIDEDKCTGCGQCVTACAEGAIEIIDGKAKLVSDVYCDGLGACLGHCPEDAISIEQREASQFDEEATKEHLAAQKKSQPTTEFVCPGMMAHDLGADKPPQQAADVDVPSQLGHWPVQLKLVSPAAPYFADADLLLAADCVPFAMGDFHNRFLKDRAVAVGCPKLDDADCYIDKLSEIIKANDLRSLTVVHMEVPCCSGLTYVARQAVARSGKPVPFEDVTVSLKGDVVDRRTVEPQPASIE